MNVIDSLLEPTECDWMQFDEMLEGWLTEFDRAEPTHDKINLNKMHVVGGVLCTKLHGLTLDESNHEEFIKSVGLNYTKILLEETPIKEMDWQQLHDMVTAVHMEFQDLIVYEKNEGFGCKIDMRQLMIAVMHRVGYWLSREWKDESDETETEQEIDLQHTDINELRGVVERSADGWCHIRSDSIVSILDLIHALMSATRLFMQATIIPGGADDIKTELYNHHREASIDDFHEMGMISDIPFGAITQYKHRFKFLFHSPSQVIFFHYPSYQRKKQLKLEQVTQFGTPTLQLVPLLMQLNTKIKAIFEHTGLGCSQAHADGWKWAVIAGHVLLIDPKLNSYYAEDARLLLDLVSDLSS